MWKKLQRLPRGPIVAHLLGATLLMLAAGGALAQTIDYQIIYTDVGAGLQSNLCRARLSTGAHGGVTVRIASSDTNLVRVTDDANLAGGEYADIFVPNGGLNADFYLQAIEDTTGAVDLTASAPGFADEILAISVVTPALRKLGLPSQLSPFDPVDPFHLQVGVANPLQTSISYPQKVRVGGPGLTTLVSVTDPLVAELVTSGETGSVIALPIAPGSDSSPTTVAGGGIGLDALAAGSVGIIATAPNFITIAPDTQFVTVPAPSTTFISLPYEVGAGLQLEGRYVQLSGSQHGGVTVHFEVSDSTRVLLAPDANSPGAGTLDVFVANGFVNASFVMQGLEGVLGSVILSVSVPGFAPQVTTVEVKTPAVRLNGLNTSIDTLDPPDNFTVAVGLPNGTATGLSVFQPVRVGGPGVTATVAVSDGAVGQILSSSTSGDTLTVSIPEGESSSPSTPAGGGVAFDGVGVGATDVTASIPGFAPVDPATATVLVTQPSLNVVSVQGTVGAGLQTAANQVNLGASQHGGVVVRVESLDPGLVLVSGHPDSLGTPFVDLPLNNGVTVVNFYSHALEGLTGAATIAVTSPLFLPDTIMTTVVEPAVRLVGLGTTIDTLDPPDPVYAIVGFPSGGFNSVVGQEVRQGSAGVPVTFTVADPVVGTMVAPGDTAAAVTLVIPPGASNTPTNTTAGGAAFDGVGVGSTAVTVSIPGGVPVNLSTATITVSAPTISFTGVARVGGGLQAQVNAQLSASGHGGTLVTLTSSDPASLLLAPDASTVGQASIDVFVAAGLTSVTYFLQGVDGQVASADVLVSAPQFTSNQRTVTVEQPAVAIVSLLGNIDVADTPDNFYARVGLPTTDNSSVNGSYIQARRAGQPPLVVTFASSAPAVAIVTTQTTSGGSLDLGIPAGQSTTPTTFATGGVALDGLTPGPTIVTASVPGFIQTGAAQVAVDVTNQNIFLNGLAGRVGAGLQSQAVAAELGESGHGGVTLTVAVSDTSLALVSTNALTLGGGSVQISVPNGQTEGLFYLQAREGTEGQQVTVTASAPGFSSALQVVDLVQAATAITQLADSMDVNVDDDEFVLQIGALTADGTGLVEAQAVRGGVAPRAVTVRSDNPAVGRLANLGGEADSLTVLFAPGVRQTPPTVAGGGLAFAPVGTGVTVVSASGPGIVASGAGVLSIELTGEIVGVGDVVPARTALGGNYPNPFNPRTTIVFELARPGAVELRVYDVSGRLVRTLQAGERFTAGRHEVVWNGRDERGAATAAGVYFVRMRSGDFTAVERMTLVK
ncbi:T9SS type A sorting domain-containing protein [bacterium]|nr:T9SS type A sorting domain-containing protein [bacterium]